VARLDADAGAFYDLKELEVAGERCNEFGSTCDCPTADGFACVEGRCAWNTVSIQPGPMCAATQIGSMCIVGNPIDSGDALLPGMPLTLAFRPFGCFSSSCTQLMDSSCAVKADANDYYVLANMCLTQNTDPSVGCTDDCGGGGQALCTTEYVLTEGTHTVHLENPYALDVTFTVPSVVSDGSLCSVMDQ
jgi:hypothetical protein